MGQALQKRAQLDAQRESEEAIRHNAEIQAIRDRSHPFIADIDRAFLHWVKKGSKRLNLDLGWGFNDAEKNVPYISRSGMNEICAQLVKQGYDVRYIVHRPMQPSGTCCVTERILLNIRYKPKDAPSFRTPFPSMPAMSPPNYCAQRDIHGHPYWPSKIRRMEVWEKERWDDKNVARATSSRAHMAAAATLCAVDPYPLPMSPGQVVPKPEQAIMPQFHEEEEE